MVLHSGETDWSDSVSLSASRLLHLTALITGWSSGTMSKYWRLSVGTRNEFRDVAHSSCKRVIVCQNNRNETKVIETRVRFVPRLGWRDWDKSTISRENTDNLPNERAKFLFHDEWQVSRRGCRQKSEGRKVCEPWAMLLSHFVEVGGACGNLHCKVVTYLGVLLSIDVVLLSLLVYVV